MLPVSFSDAAQNFISEQESITLFIRVWGITRGGGIAIEIYDSDLRMSDRIHNPFTNVEVTEFVEDNIRLLVPNHHIEYVRGSVVSWTDDEDAREGQFVHGGFFHEIQNEVSTEGLLFTREEVWEISQRVLWPQYHPPEFVDAGPGINWYLDELGKECFTYEEVCTAVDAGHYSIAKASGWLEEDD